MKIGWKGVAYAIGLVLVSAGLIAWRIFCRRATRAGVVANLDPPLMPDTRGSDEAFAAYQDEVREYDRRVDEITNETLKMQSDEVIAEFKRRFHADS